MLKIILKGDVPSKKNSRVLSFRGLRPFSFPSANYKEWHEYAMWQLYSTQIKAELDKIKLPIKECEINVIFYPSNKRKADLSNKFESIADLLVDFRVIEDDNWFVVKSVGIKFGEIDCDDPRVEIEIR